MLNTNRGMSQWGDIFDDTVVAAALLDRLMHRAVMVAIDGESYRMRAHQQNIEQLRKGLGPTTDSD